MVPDEILLRQFIPATQRLAQSEFSYKDDGYKKKIQEVTNAWKQIHRMKRLAVEPMVTPEYNEWWSKRVNDNIPKMREEDIWLIELYLQVEIYEEMTKADQWEKKFQDARAREVALEKSLLECQNKKMGLKARVTKLEKSLH
ncbi:hypothetical protein Golax_025880 [Gossypium laxum]|uniref:Uncharacterized protein n=1 Tax=Gossypium laxum TaxID=34288 RepID=A0A7J9AYU8_9ROSI|nr:hypothetical protein [Gossypium laxum]